MMIEISHAWLNGEWVYEKQTSQDHILVKVNYCFVLEQDIDQDQVYALEAVYDTKLQEWDYQEVRLWTEDKTGGNNLALQVFADEIGREIEKWFDHSIECRIKNKLHL